MPGGLAGLLQWRAPADDLVGVALEEQLATAAGAERLLSGIPDRRPRAGEVGICGPQLVRGRTPRLRRDEHLAGAVSAEIAIKLGSKHRWPPDLARWNDDGALVVPYRRTSGRVSVSAVTKGYESAAPPDEGLSDGGNVQRDELGGIAQDRELADHPARDDVEVVVAVILAGIRDVVVPDDDDVK